MAMAVVFFAAACMTACARTAEAWTVSCSNPLSPCYGQLRTCPQNCAQWCEVNCVSCLVECACDKPGAVCQDPRFIGGDGVMFYFHGQKDRDFCIVSDPALHINAHFIGKRGKGMERDFTWVQSLGIVFASHRFFLGAKTVATWDNHIDALALSFDGEPIVLAPRLGSTYEAPHAGLRVTRVEGKNVVSVEVIGNFKLEAHVVPISKQESRVHKYEITSDNCFAHLELNFQFFHLSTEVNGVLGQTYVPGYTSPISVGDPMPTLGNELDYFTSSIFQTDCAVSRFGAVSSGTSTAGSASCKNSDSGFVCRR